MGRGGAGACVAGFSAVCAGAWGGRAGGRAGRHAVSRRACAAWRRSLKVRRAARVVCAQARVQYMKDLKSGKNKGAATMAWVRTLAAAHSNGC